MNKILIVPPGIQGGWYMSANYEYLIRYLGDEFFIEIADIPYPPYTNFLDRFPEVSPFMRNPDDYDLILPMIATHWGVIERDKYAHKIAIINYEAGDGRHDDVAVNGCVNPMAELECTTANHKFHSLRFGIDTELFQPYPMIREDDLLHVGIVGTLSNPRRQILEGVAPLFDMPGVRFMFFPSTWINDGNIERSGGTEFLKRVVTGEKYWTGLPNIYNRMDVLVRIDSSFGYSFPTLEAASCAVPVITTYQGIDHFITEAGGGTLLLPDEGGPRWPFYHDEELQKKLKEAIEFVRDNPEKRKEMGKAGRVEIEKNWTWPKLIPAWRE